MGEKYGITRSQAMKDIRECTSYLEAVRAAAASNGAYVVVFYAHGQWWF